MQLNAGHVFMGIHQPLTQYFTHKHKEDLRVITFVK